MHHGVPGRRVRRRRGARRRVGDGGLVLERKDPETVAAAVDRGASTTRRCGRRWSPRAARAPRSSTRSGRAPRSSPRSKARVAAREGRGGRSALRRRGDRRLRVGGARAVGVAGEGDRGRGRDPHHDRARLDDVGRALPGGHDQRGGRHRAPLPRHERPGAATATRAARRCWRVPARCHSAEQHAWLELQGPVVARARRRGRARPTPTWCRSIRTSSGPTSPRTRAARVPVVFHPYAHDEAPLRLSMYAPLFEAERGRRVPGRRRAPPVRAPVLDRGAPRAHARVRASRPRPGAAADVAARARPRRSARTCSASAASTTARARGCSSTGSPRTRSAGPARSRSCTRARSSTRCPTHPDVLVVGHGRRAGQVGPAARRGHAREPVGQRVVLARAARGVGRRGARGRERPLRGDPRALRALRAAGSGSTSYAQFEADRRPVSTTPICARRRRTGRRVRRAFVPLAHARAPLRGLPRACVARVGSDRGDEHRRVTTRPSPRRRSRRRDSTAAANRSRVVRLTYARIANELRRRFPTAPTTAATSARAATRRPHGPQRLRALRPVHEQRRRRRVPRVALPSRQSHARLRLRVRVRGRGAARGRCRRRGCRRQLLRDRPRDRGRARPRAPGQPARPAPVRRRELRRRHRARDARAPAARRDRRRDRASCGACRAGTCSRRSRRSDPTRTVPAVGTTARCATSGSRTTSELPDTYEGPVPYDDLAVDAEGNPLEGHLTIASFGWWTKQFEAAGFERCGEIERRIHPHLARFGLTKFWCLYVLRVPGVAGRHRRRAHPEPRSTRSRNAGSLTPRPNDPADFEAVEAARTQPLTQRLPQDGDVDRRAR